MTPTPRQAAILEKLAAGRSQKEAAADLHITHGTVRQYIHRAKQRLNMRTTAQLLAHFARLACLLLAVAAFGQNTHGVTLTWTDPNNPTGTTYNLYRTTGLCSGSAAFAKIATGITALTYTDSAVTPGPYCYYATAVVNGVESTPSPMTNPTVPAFSPATLAVTSVK